LNYKLEKDAALSAARKAGKLCSRIQSELIDNATLYKDDKSPVTVADFSAQALICKIIRDAFPDDPIVGEEDSAALRSFENMEALNKVTSYVADNIPESLAAPNDVCGWIDLGSGDCSSDRFWTLDPIDGTKGFIRGDQYAVALALIEEGVVKVGVLACPNLAMDTAGQNSEAGVIFVAVKGQGAEMRSLNNGHAKKISVSDTSSHSEARLVEGVESGHSNHGRQSAIANSLGITKDSIRVDSQVKYGILARGDAEIYLRLPSPGTPDYRENIWDHAAGALIAEEAGGIVTDISGAPLDFTAGKKLVNNRGVVVSNGRFHDDLIRMVKSRL